MTARAVIDVGSNAARLLVADGGKAVLRRSRITGLAEGLGASGVLSSTALARTAAVLEDYRAELGEQGATLARVLGTAAARAAGNVEDLAALVADVLGCSLDVLAPHEEARLTFLGAAGGDGRGRRLVVDIGGVAGRRRGRAELVIDAYARRDEPAPRLFMCSRSFGGNSEPDKQQFSLGYAHSGGAPAAALH